MRKKGWIEEILEHATKEVRSWPTHWQKESARTGMTVWKPYKKK